MLIISPLLIYFGFQWSFFLSAWFGLLIHIFLDYTNTYGISLFYPISKKRYSLDILFFIDSVTLSLTLIVYISYFLLHLNLSLLYILFFISYLILKINLRKRLKKRIRFDFAIPSSFNPFEFYIYRKNDDYIETYLYNLWSNSKLDIKKIDMVDKKYRYLTDKSQVFQDIKLITKALHIIKVFNTNQEIKIEASDLAVRNYGGKFGTTILIFDKKGELKSEMANI
jgi:inner membrane protein